MPASCAARRTPAIGSIIGKRSGARGETAAIDSDSGKADRFGPGHVAYRCTGHKAGDALTPTDVLTERGEKRVFLLLERGVPGAWQHDEARIRDQRPVGLAKH